MADDADLENDRLEMELALRVSAMAGYEIPAGKQGECDLCGEWSGRLVEGACVPCRDRYQGRHAV